MPSLSYVTENRQIYIYIVSASGNAATTASFCEVQLSIKKASQLARIKLNTVHTTQSFIFLTILLVHRPGFLDSFEVL